MKSLTKAIAVASLASVSVAATAVEGLSATAGAVSDYYFRAVNLGDASVYGSVDYEMAGFYAGIWVIDDTDQSAGGNDGLENDWYLGYGWEQDDFSAGIGYTRYEYTYDTGFQADPLGVGQDVNTSAQFEHEIALSVGFAGFGLDFATGTAEAEHVATGGGALADGTALDTEQDYDVITLSYSNDNMSVVLAQVDKDNIDADIVGEITNSESEYKYLELSSSKEISGLNFTATIGKQFDIENGSVDSSSKGNEYIVLDISKGFDL